MGVVPQLALDDSKCSKPSCSFIWVFRKAMKESTGVMWWLVAAYDIGVSGHCRQLQRIFFNFTRATADSYVSNAVAKRKTNTFSPCSQTRGKLHDSGTSEHPTNRTPVSPIFSVHKMVADALPDVMSPTFLHTLAYVQVVHCNTCCDWTNYAVLLGFLVLFAQCTLRSLRCLCVALKHTPLEFTGGSVVVYVNHESDCRVQSENMQDKKPALKGLYTHTTYCRSAVQLSWITSTHVLLNFSHKHLL